MQEGTHEMGQTVLELFYEWSVAWLRVSERPYLRDGAHLTDCCHSCAVALSTETAPWYQENAPGLIRTIGSCFFPVGLIMIVLSGADLFTSNVMVKHGYSWKRTTAADTL